MKTITSKENPAFKAARKLSASARERRKACRTLLDGIHLVTAFCQEGGLPEAVMVAASAQEDAEIRDFIARIQPANLLVLADELFREISTVDTPTGIVALISIPLSPEIEGECCVLLEDIQDPGNLGSILRSAAASGIRQIFLSSGCADAWSPKALRAGMGAHFRLSIHEDGDLSKIAGDFRGTVVAATLTAEKSLFDLDLSGTVAFIIGNEGAGISAQLSDIANSHVTIPMPGAIESLNAAAAAAVCFFERVRQVTAKGKNV